MTPTTPIQLETHAVTGAFGYSGKYITQRLLDRGLSVITLTNSPLRKNPFGNRLRAYRFNWEDPFHLVEALHGVRVLYNTYWVRFDHPRFTFDEAVQNSRVLFEAARDAGVERIVHVSILNPSARSPYPYYRGKTLVEDALRASGLSHTILRPGVIFGHEDILINNIAWALRKLPLFGVFADGSYRVQPIYVEDFADIAVREGLSRETKIINTIGPETFTYRSLVETIASALGIRRRIISVPPWLGHAVGKLLGDFKGDVFITRDEIGALIDNLLYVDSSVPAASIDTPVTETGPTKLTDWARTHADTLGRAYASELVRRTDRKSSY